METKFQTSFIPKRPLTPTGVPSGVTHHRTTSIFMTLAVLLFVVSLAAVGGAYAWKAVLASSQDIYKQQLAEREKQFNVDLIEHLKQVNIQIDLAKQLIENHLAMSQIFDIISKLTIERVRFLSLDLSAPNPQSGDIKISMRGYGTNLSAVAFQSDVLGQLEQYGLRKVVKNPILSDPSLDANGTVSFNFTASIDPTSLSYEKSVSAPTSSVPLNSGTSTQDTSI